MPACVSARLPYALRRLLGKTRRTSSSSATLGLFYHPPLGQEDLRHDLEHISGPPAPDLELAFPADAGRLVPRDIGALQLGAAAVGAGGPLPPEVRRYPGGRACPHRRGTQAPGLALGGRLYVPNRGGDLPAQAAGGKIDPTWPTNSTSSWSSPTTGATRTAAWLTRTRASTPRSRPR